jgi:GTP-binding protein LepA
MTSGHASMDYEHIGYKSGELGRFDILVAGELVDSLSSIIHKDKAQSKGRVMVKKL